MYHRLEPFQDQKKTTSQHEEHTLLINVLLVIVWFLLKCFPAFRESSPVCLEQSNRVWSPNACVRLKGDCLIFQTNAIIIKRWRFPVAKLHVIKSYDRSSLHSPGIELIKTVFMICSTKHHCQQAHIILFLFLKDYCIAQLIWI